MELPSEKATRGFTRDLNITNCVSRGGVRAESVSDGDSLIAVPYVSSSEQPSPPPDFTVNDFKSSDQ